MKKNLEIEKSLERILKTEKAKTQNEIVIFLEQEGFLINQSKISRLLKKLGAIRFNNEIGELVYGLPKDPPSPKKNILIKELIFGIFRNECMLFISTSPGAANIIARILDHNLSNKILGTLAGDDSIIVVPKSIKDLEFLEEDVQRIFYFK